METETTNYDESEHHVIKLSGIPYSASLEDVAYFMAGVDIKGGRRNGVHLTKDDTGRPSGEAFIELMCEEDLTIALRKDREYMGERWIAVAKSTYAALREDVDKIGTLKRQLDEKGDYVVKIRGLPWSTTASDVENFFQDSQLKEDAQSSIHILRNAEGRLTGQALVEFKGSDDLQAALKRNREHMGKRYLEITRSDMQELQRLNSKSNTAAKGRDPVVLLRGLPFSCTNEEIETFFQGLSVTDIQLVYDSAGTKPMGKAFVAFTTTKDCEQALLKHGEKIGSRYVEIFQSNRKYWHERDGVLDNSGPQSFSQRGGSQEFRGRPRSSPYAREDARGAGPRSKQMVHVRGASSYQASGYQGGYDGAEGYFPPHQEYSVAGSNGRPAPPATKHAVLAKGLSLEVSIGDVIKFFADKHFLPKNVEMKYGEAVVEFNSHEDAMHAMLKDKEQLGGQRVHLELQSKPADYVAETAASDYVQDYSGHTYSDTYQSASKSYQAQQLQGGYKMW